MKTVLMVCHANTARSVMAQALLEKETLDSREIDRIIASFKNPEDTPEPQEVAPPLPLGLQQA